MATEGLEITLSGREFHVFTTRLEKKWPSLADSETECGYSLEYILFIVIFTSEET